MNRYIITLVVLLASSNSYAKPANSDYGYFSSYKVTIEETKLICRVDEHIDSDVWKEKMLSIEGNEEILRAMTMGRVNKDGKAYWQNVNKVKCPEK